MHLIDLAYQNGDPALLQALETLGDLGMKVNHIGATSEAPARLELLDKDGRTVLACTVRLAPLDQLAEMVGIYIDTTLQPWMTRH